AIMAGPWVVRDWIWYQNPVAPLGSWLFRNPYVHVMFEKEYTAYMRRYEVEDLRTLPLEVTVRGEKTTGVIGPVFLLAPLVLLALRLHAGRRLLAAGLLVGATYLGNFGTRFLIPCLPFFSLGIALAFGEAAPILVILMLLHSAASWPRYLNKYVHP